MRHRRLTLCLIVLTTEVLCLALTAKFYRNPFDPMDSGREPVTGEYLHRTMDSVQGQFGSPSHQWHGHYGSPSDDYTKQHKPSITMTYIRSTGILYLSFEQVGDDWVCYSSD